MPLPPKRLLIVEDEPMIAAYVKELAAEQGYQTVAIAATLAEATASASTMDIDVAVLDVSLHHKETAAVAVILRQRRIPFIVATGYATLPDEFMNPIIVPKPYSGEQLLAALNSVAVRAIAEA